MDTEVSESVIEPTAAKEPAKRKPRVVDEVPSIVVFRSRGAEGTSFRLLDVRPIRNPDFPGLYEWHIPFDLADKASTHHHVVTGRIVRVN